MATWAAWLQLVAGNHGPSCVHAEGRLQIRNNVTIYLLHLDSPRILCNVLLLLPSSQSATWRVPDTLKYVGPVHPRAQHNPPKEIQYTETKPNQTEPKQKRTQTKTTGKSQSHLKEPKCIPRPLQLLSPSPLVLSHKDGTARMAHHVRVIGIA